MESKNIIQHINGNIVSSILINLSILSMAQLNKTYQWIVSMEFDCKNQVTTVSGCQPNYRNTETHAVTRRNMSVQK